MAIRRLAFCPLVLCLTSCAARDNELYIERLASVVLGYQQRHGELPEVFEIAHDESGVVLPNRGDAYGLPLFYLRCGERGFMFRALGPNGRDDCGLGDDLDLYYLDRRRVSREAFVDYLRSLDHGDLWRFEFRDLFGDSSPISTLDGKRGSGAKLKQK